MRLTANEFIVKSKSGIIYGAIQGKDFSVIPADADYSLYNEFYTEVRPYSEFDRERKYAELQTSGRYNRIFGISEATEKKVAEEEKVVNKPNEMSAKEKLMRGLQNLMNFFTEFNFCPSFRFTNTFSFMACKSLESAQEYVGNYFALMDSSYVSDVVQKVKSPEFKLIVSDIAQYGQPNNTINNRMKIYFGPAGTGKTTIAQEESENRCIVCNASMLPADLMEDFVFTDGNPDFNPSLLWNCMEQGKTIVLDEINLLPFDSLRFLQGVVDGKSEFYYKNRPVHIHEGFQIIGTMNLSLGGMVYGLPEPLVDRCSETKEFKLTAEQLAKAIMGWDAE